MLVFYIFIYIYYIIKYKKKLYTHLYNKDHIIISEDYNFTQKNEYDIYKRDVIGSLVITIFK